MSDHEHTHITTPLLARGFDVTNPEESAARYAAAGRLMEMCAYEEATSVIGSDPDYGYRIVSMQVEPNYPGIKARLLVDLAAAMAARADANRPGGINDQRRSAAFMADPSKYLPGSARAPIRLGPPGFGYIEVEGRNYPWAYAASAYARSDIAELVELMQRLGFERGYAVGAPGTGRTLSLPDGVAFIGVPLEGKAA